MGASRRGWEHRGADGGIAAPGGVATVGERFAFPFVHYGAGSTAMVAVLEDTPAMVTMSGMAGPVGAPTGTCNVDLV